MTMPPRFDIYDRPKKPSTLDGGWTARRKCECCKVTRSATQFVCAETVCKKCKLRQAWVAK